jgi:hypothetical protein
MNRTLIKHIVKEILLEINRFTFKPQSGDSKGKKRFFPPPFLTLTKDIRDKFKDLFKYYGGVLYVDSKVPIALGYLERGRQSYEKTQNFPSLTKTLQDKLPQEVRLAIKKGVTGQKVTDINGQAMIPLNLKVIRDEQGNYLIKNPASWDSLEEYEIELNELLIQEILANK